MDQMESYSHTHIHGNIQTMLKTFSTVFPHNVAHSILGHWLQRITSWIPNKAKLWIAFKTIENFKWFAQEMSLQECTKKFKQFFGFNGTSCMTFLKEIPFDCSLCVFALKTMGTRIIEEPMNGKETFNSTLIQWGHLKRVKKSWEGSTHTESLQSVTERAKQTRRQSRILVNKLFAMPVYHNNKLGWLGWCSSQLPDHRPTDRLG